MSKGSVVCKDFESQVGSTDWTSELWTVCNGEGVRECVKVRGKGNRARRGVRGGEIGFAIRSH